ncbi:MAG: TonB-dependent receptor, partial [Sphingobacteriales bacterium]
MKNKMPRGETRMTLSAGVALAAIFGAYPAFAQSDESVARDAARGADGGSLLAEIVVTAQRREENVQSVPIAITALGGRQLAELNIHDAQRIVDFVPNFKAGGLGGPGGPPFFNIRGISFVDFSNINEGSVALYVDDIYQTAQGAGSAQLFDLERVEVLRGPQGTLFGRNTTAGLVHYVTRKPTDNFFGDVSLQYGSYDQMILQMAAGGAVTEGLRARFALKYNRDDGWQKDPRNGNSYAVTNAIAARFIGQADLGPSATIEAKIEYAHNAGQTAVPRPLFLLDPANPSGYCGGRPVPGTAADRAHAACILSSQGVSRTAGKALAGFKATQAISDAGDLPFNYTSWGGYMKASADLGFGELVAI